MSILRRRALIEQGDSRPYWYDIDEDWDYIIDQTGKYENPIIVNEDNLSANKLTSISDIRSMSKLVIGYYDETSAKLIWEPLDNSSKTIVKHSTSVRTINMKVSSYIAEHPTADIFMKLPEFWWRCWNVNDNEDTVAFKFTIEEPTDNNTWNHWDGNIFIGVYKGHIDEINNVKLLRSISGASISREVLSTFKTSSRNKGAGYRCISYEAHQIMALLFFGLYGKANDEEVCYDYFDTPYNTTGITDVVGIEEDRSYQITDCFWGFENWLIADNSDLEIIENLYTLYNSNYQTLSLDDINGLNIRYINCRQVLQSSPLKLILGTDADLIIKERDYNEKFLFYGHSEVSNVAQRYAMRGSHITGLITLADKDNSTYYSRLQYEGNNEQYNGLNPPAITISSYTIDQTGSANTKPADMITFNTDNKVFIDIKANSDFYALENKDWGSDTPEFIKMSKTNKLITAEGNTLNPDNYDIFMKLPEFWWKCENVDNNEDIVKFSFTMTNPNDNTWYRWEGNTFVGVYRSYYENHKLYSRSGVTPYTISETFNGFKQTARNRGNGFQLLTYEVSQILAILGYGYFGTLSFYDIYNTRYNRVYASKLDTGGLNTSGFNDEWIKDKYYNYWGLENWGIPYSGILTREMIDNLKTRFENGKWYADILDYNNNLIRSVQIDSRTYSMGGSVPYTIKVVFGNYGDIFPKEVVGGYGRCYDCEEAIYNFQDSPIYKYDNITGLASKSTTQSYSNDYSRLVYKGNYTVAQELQI